jgi:hypothetical protein
MYIKEIRISRNRVMRIRDEGSKHLTFDTFPAFVIFRLTISSSWNLLTQCQCLNKNTSYKSLFLKKIRYCPDLKFAYFSDFYSVQITIQIRTLLQSHSPEMPNNSRRNLAASTCILQHLTSFNLFKGPPRSVFSPCWSSKQFYQCIFSSRLILYFIGQTASYMFLHCNPVFATIYTVIRSLLLCVMCIHPVNLFFKVLPYDL